MSGDRGLPPTRATERRALVRGFITDAAIRHVGEQYVELDVTAASDSSRTAWGNRDGFTLEPSDGTLRIDVVADDVFRVRYSPAPVSTNTSRMIVGALPAPTAPIDVEESSETISLTTARAVMRVRRSDCTLTVRTHDGIDRCRIGGTERNLFFEWDSLSTGVSTTIEGRPVATETYALRPGEAVFGLGEQFGRLEKSGQTIDLDMTDAMGTTSPRAYKNIPFFWTSHGYGVFWHTTARATVWVGSRSATDIQVAIDADHIDYYLFVGDPKTILDRYTTLTGKSSVPPRWSFGWWQSKISYTSATEALDVARRYRSNQLPIDVLHLDTHWFSEDWRCNLEFDAERFPDPAAFFAEMRELGVRVSLWQLPYIPEGSRLFDELDAVGGFVADADGDLYDVGICLTPGFEGRVGCIDFTNPAGVAVYQRHLRRLFELGAAAIKADFGEQAPIDGIYHDGTPGRDAHNLYPLLYNQAVAEVTEQSTDDWIIWARSAWAGSQRYPVHWGGDSSANWGNLASQFAAGLSLGASGFTFWSQDIGGFLAPAPVGGDLLVRWVQAGLLVSHARIHGVGPRELDTLPGDVLAAIRPILGLRYQLLPYLTGEAIRAAAAGLPMARPLVIEFPNDPTTFHIDDQWLCGEHLLVAPQFDRSGRRRVYLPEGYWLDWWSDEVTQGNRWVTVDSQLQHIPLWVRDGGVIPLGPAMNHVDEHPVDHLVLRGLAPADGRETAGLIGLADHNLSWTWSTELDVERTDLRVARRLRTWRNVGA
ncbi:MAG: TIM-barrel domain-containing protein [Actinomycetota bacterium]